MILNTEPIKNWFGFTRRERRSTFSLLVIIVVLLVIRYTVPDSSLPVKNISAEVIETENSRVDLENDSSSKSSKVKFKTYPKKTFRKSGTDLSASKVSYVIKQEDRKIGSKIIDINLSDTSALITLPGIGPVLSVRIIKYRNYLGGYARVEQLKEVYGLSEETFEMIKSHVKADSAFIKRLNINTVEYKELTRVRYLEKYEITSILKYRQLMGRIAKIDDLVDNKLITKEKVKQIRPYVRLE